MANDTTRSHYHGQPAHTHSVGTQLSSTAVSGSAAAQTFQDRHTAGGLYSGTPPAWPGSGSAEYVAWVSGSGVEDRVMAYMGGDFTYHQTEGPSAVSGNLINGSATGTAHSSGADNTYQNSNSDGTTGGSETAPQHTRVRYLIRALP